MQIPHAESEKQAQYDAMSDRKYRQRGYQDDDRDRQPRPSPGPRGPERERDSRYSTPTAPRTPNLMGYQQTVRCTQCGHVLTATIDRTASCTRCGAALHSCAQCSSFDPGARFQCMQPLTAPVTPKDTGNDCSLFEPRTRVERQTGTQGPPSARQAFDDLFK
jgi:hypothetical protein